MFLYADNKHSLHQVTVLMMLAAGQSDCSSTCLSDISHNESRVTDLSMKLGENRQRKESNETAPYVGSEVKVVLQENKIGWLSSVFQKAR